MTARRRVSTSHQDMLVPLRMAQRIAGHDDPVFDLPIYDSPLQFPAQGEWAAPFRRFGQSMLYRWYYLRDEVI